MSVYTMFSVPIIHYEIENWAENKQKIMAALPNHKKEHYEVSDDSITGLYTDFYKNAEVGNDTLPDYASVVIDIIKPYLQDFTDQRRVEFTDMWYQTEEYGSSHGLHNHGHSGWSSVIYVDFDPQIHTATQFFSPFNNPWNGNLEAYQPPVKEGDMVIFPSTIAHEALPNSSRVPRTVISYNLRGHTDVVKYQLWQGDPIVRRLIDKRYGDGMQP